MLRSAAQLSAPLGCPRTAVRWRAGTRPSGVRVRALRGALVALAVTRVGAAQAGGVSALPGSTRSAGLAGAGVALMGDAGAIFANPAGIATIRHLGLEGSYEQYLGGATFASAATAVRVGRFDYGVGAQTLDYPAASPTPPTEVLGTSALVVRYGLLALGSALKYSRETASSGPATAWGADVGAALALFDIMALGASVQNVGGNATALLAQRTRVGFTMN
jgi:hypothetical protein